MLLKKEKPAQIDYLENWPEHYYEIENAKERKEILAQAISRGLDLPNDNYRMKLLEKRYGKDGKNDAFMKAWMMIKASGAAGISFFNKRHLQKELKQYMKDLCLLEYAPENETEQAVLLTEWENFAKVLLASCTGSKTYCSTLAQNGRQMPRNRLALAVGVRCKKNRGRDRLRHKNLPTKARTC